MRSIKTLPITCGLALSLFACGGGGGDGGPDTPDSGMPPTPQGPPTVAYIAADPCNATVPKPTDLFRDEGGVDTSATCAAPSDPIEAAIKAALADDGVAIDTAITIPLTADVDIATISSTTATILLRRTGSGTTADDWERVAHTRQLEGTTLRIVPAGPLEPASYYTVVLTDVVTSSNKPLGQHPAIKALVGNSTIVAGAYEGLNEETAMRLERERQRLAPVVSLLERGMPPLARTQIRSIQGFSTSLGFARIEKAIADYRAATMAGNFAYSVEAGAEIMPVDVYPAGTPPSFYENVRSFLKGTIRVPKVVDEEGRMISDWAEAGETINVPFLLSQPTGGNYTVAVYLPGMLGSKQDIREIASDIAGAPRGAVFGYDLRCHGDRSMGVDGICKDERTAAEIGMLVDQNPNGNPERTGPNGVPDNSGAGYFPGDARALRDTQIASVIEVVHVLETFQRGAAVLMPEGITPNTGDIHLIAHGHSAPVGLLASVFTRGALRTVVTPSGGASVRQLIEGGPNELKAAFDETLPAGVTSANRGTYLMRVEATVLQAISYERAGELAVERYIRPAPNAERVLLPHGEIPGFVPMAARTALIDAMNLDGEQRVSRHFGNCDEFYLHTCRLGDNIAWGQRAREQIATFIGSKGVTVLAPSPR